MIKGAIFDLDGTLIDSMGVWSQIDVDFLGKRGFKVPDDYIESIVAMDFNQAACYTIKRFELAETPESVVKEWYDMAIEAYSNTVKLKEGVYEYLELLQQKSIKMAIATASDLQLVIPVLKNNNVLGFFENITTAMEVERKKGFPDIYDLAAKKMGLKTYECIVFEDIYQGVKGAKSGGYRTIGVYDKHSINQQLMIKEISDRYILNFNNCDFPL